MTPKITLDSVHSLTVGPFFFLFSVARHLSHDMQRYETWAQKGMILADSYLAYY